MDPAVLEQRIARAHRMGRQRPVQVCVLITEETMEENLLSTLSAKHKLPLAALDAESDVDAVDLASGMEELKGRLEVLLGAKPEAPVDESERIRQTEEATRFAPKEKDAPPKLSCTLARKYWIRALDGEGVLGETTGLGWTVPGRLSLEPPGRVAVTAITDGDQARDSSRTTGAI